MAFNLEVLGQIAEDHRRKRQETDQFNLQMMLQDVAEKKAQRDLAERRDYAEAQIDDQRVYNMEALLDERDYREKLADDERLRNEKNALAQLMAGIGDISGVPGATPEQASAYKGQYTSQKDLQDELTRARIGQANYRAPVKPTATETKDVAFENTKNFVLSNANRYLNRASTLTDNYAGLKEEEVPGTGWFEGIYPIWRESVETGKTKEEIISGLGDPSKFDPEALKAWDALESHIVDEIEKMMRSDMTGVGLPESVQSNARAMAILIFDNMLRQRLAGGNTDEDTETTVAPQPPGTTQVEPENISGLFQVGPEAVNVITNAFK
jgi:hypothetical protein